ncbi:MAG: AmmeMemoRadiSam system protein A [bacterium]
MSGQSQFLTESEQRTLLSLARNAVQAAVVGTSFDLPAATENLNQNCGVFVTLHRHGDLRGCLGRFEPDEIPLLELVATMAQEAALHDNRFAPISAKEIDELDIEISVLTPMLQIHNPEQVEVGRHGLFIVGKSPMGGRRHGTLLPQVASEQGWDRLAFLENTCRKAGLASDAWKDDETEIYVYEAEVFGEKELGMWPPK